MAIFNVFQVGETKPQNVQTAQTPQITKDLEELHPVKSTDYKNHFKRICVNLYKK